MSTDVKRDIDNFYIEDNHRSFRVEAIFVDLDGTLLDKFSKKISKKNIEVIKQIQKTTHVVVSTGRSYSKKVKNIMNLLDIKYAICQNGAIVVDNEGNILKNITLSKECIQDVVQIVKERKLGFTINSEFLIYTDHWLWATLTFLWRKKWKRINKFEPKDNYVNKIVIAGLLKKEKVWNLASSIADKFKNLSVKTSGRDKIIEVTDKDATKGNAAVFVAKILKVDIKNTIHIGDSGNDSTTLGKVGALIAMKNSSTVLLDVATHIGPKHKRGGVAKLLQGDFVKNDKTN